ncbi:MAG: putative Ig domain-containing protein [Verrucomicrobiota bacterium]
MANLAVANGSNNAAISPNINISANALTGTTLGLRARLATTSGASSIGTLGTAGEIEDYVLTVSAPTTDFGDVQGFASASSTVNANLRIGALTDAEYAPTNNTAATGDDTSGTDDEDGVVIPVMTAGAPATMPVVVTNNTGSIAYLNAWIDYNDDGDFVDSGENVTVNQGILSGTSNATQNLDFTVPANAATTTVLGLRVRLTSTSSPGPTGLSGNGEVEDYAVTIATPPLDYGDTNVLAQASSTANSALRLGATVDTEFTPTINSTATGDDITGNDDEDGVSIPVMTAGAPATITVTATNASGAAAFLNTWIDFNGNGGVTDPGEQIATNVNVANGTSAGSFPINFTVPAAAVTGATIVVRVRLTSISNPGTIGLSGTGEVEDYVTTIAVPVTDFGDWSGLASASSIQSSNLRMGSLTDTEYVSTQNAAASGDDSTASDDEDGVSLAGGYSLGAAGSLTVTATNLSGAAAYLNVWLDFNNNNSVADAGEQIATNVVVNNGTNGAAQTVNFTVPATAIPGLRGARFRLTNTSSPGISGASGMGEVEDHLVNIYCPTISVSPATLNTGTAGSAFSQTMTASGGSGPYAWSVSEGVLPTGLTLNASTGVVSGTPASGNGAGTTITITATDSNGCTGDREAVLKVCPVIAVGPTTLATPTVGTFYSQAITPANGAAPYTFVRSSGTLPSWASLNASTGVISGTPTSTTSTTFTIRATDANGCIGSRSYILTPVCPTVSISPAAVPAARVSTAYSTTLSASGGTAPYGSWTITAGTLPAGLTLNSTSGVISGTPTVVTSPGTNVTVRVTDTYGCQGTQVVTVQICPAITVNPTSLSNGTVTQSYSATASASGGVSPYTFGVSSGAFPSWATLNASTGAITGTPNSTDSSTFTISATDANGCVGTRSYTITPACPAILISATVLPQSTAGDPYSHTLTPTGGVGPYSSFTITSGSLPLGLSLNSSGVISGTPLFTNGSGTSITIRATDSNGCQGTQTLNFKVCPTITVNPTSLPNGTVGLAYTQTVSTSGGTSPYVYTVSSGSLPGWATLNASAGVISGTPNSASSSAFTLRSTDANGCIATRSYTITPACPAISITPTSLPNGLVGTAYSRTLNASGGTAPYIWTLASGTLPTNLTFSSGGVLSGTPTTGNGAGINLTFRATDTYGCQQTLTLALQICPVVTVSPTSLAAGVVSAPYNQTVTSSGGVAPYLYALSIGALPPGLTLDANTGAISGTPTSSISASFTISATDANGCIGTRAYTLPVSCPTITISPPTLPAGLVGAAYSQTVTANGGTAPYAWNVSAGTLPAGLILSNTGVLSGTPTASNGAGVNVTLRAVDNTGCAATRAFVIVVCPAIDLSPTTLSNGTVGSSYSQTVSGTGGTGPYTFSLASGSLSWATINTTTGAISGIPTSTETVSFTLRATDANGCAGTRAYSITPVCPVISATPASAARGIVGSVYTQTLSASGGTAPYSGWTVVSGSLPAGLNLNSGTGQINGTPTASNGLGASFTVRVTDTYGCQGTQVISLQICPAITLSPSTMPAAVVGTPFTTTIISTGGAGPYIFALSSGSLPAWASLSTSTGEITGTPSGTTSATFTISATDANGCIGSRAHSITPTCPVLSITPTALTAYLATPFSQTLTASGGTAPYGNWAIASGTLPAGLSLNTSTGVISGTATAASSNSVSVRVSDAYGCQSTQTVSINAKGLTLGNLVWQDSNNDGVRDAGEPALAGAQVQLMDPGADNEIGGVSPDVQVGAVMTTGADGLYSFSNLRPGNYFVRVIPPPGFTQTGGTPSTADDDIDGNNDASLPDGPGMPLVSPVITLSIGGESITDGDGDPDTNLTVDFGIWSPVGVGNLVFIDLNGNGKFDLQEGIEGVYIFIFRQGANVQTDEAIGIALTDNEGRYYIDALLPGSYFLHIPASQFQTGAPLAGMIPMTSVVAGDDNVGQNLLSAASPSSTGASTAVFTLAPGTEPTGSAESGYQGTVDDAFIDANNDFTIDLGLRSASGTGYPLAQRDRNTNSVGTSNGGTSSGSTTTQPVTFATWSAQHSGADDADLYPALLEYALDTDPADGRSGAGTFLIQTTTTGHADVVFTRPASGRADIRHELETSLDGISWSAIHLTAALSIGSDGRQIVRYADVDQAMLAQRALFRLKVMLDSNLDGTAEATAATPSVMFSRETFPVGQRSFSMPLAKPELYAGTITLSGATAAFAQPVTLPASTPLYLEDLQGGLTYEVDESASTSTSIRLESSPPAGLTRAALRAHHTLGELLPANILSVTDRVLTFDAATNSFLPCAVTAEGWETNLVLPKQSGLLVHLREVEATHLFTGQVSAKPLLVPAAGTRFLGSASAVAESPASLGLSTDTGFRSSTRPTSATRLRLWKSDADMSNTGYDNLYLSPTQWQRQDDATLRDLTNEKLLGPFRAFFLVP